MYWLTKMPCPKCSNVFELDELKYAKLVIRRELGYEPSNGWPTESCNWDIGLVKIYLRGIKSEEPREFLMQCFACGYTAPEKDLQDFVDSKSEHKRRIRHRGRFPRDVYRPDRRIRDNTPIEKRNYHYATLKDFSLENKLKST